MGIFLRNKIKHVLKPLLLFVTVLNLIFLNNCATTIPETDTTPSRIELIVNGPGTGSQSISNPPREYWTGDGGIPFLNLQADTRYNFSLIVSDWKFTFNSIKIIHSRLI